MLRIGRGIWRSQVLRPDLKGVRPTPSRVREALINILADRLPGAVVWDLFSGSGAFGIECVSCGAEKALFLDSSPRNLVLIKKFFEKNRSADSCITVKGRMPDVFNRLIPPADIIFMDPPYASSDIYLWIQQFPWDTVANPGGVVVVESGGTEFDPHWKHRKYGDTHLHILEVE